MTTTNCPKCNTVVKAGDKFCPDCGNAITQANYCPQCGTQLGLGDRFCPSCGQAFGVPPGDTEELYQKVASLLNPPLSFEKCKKAQMMLGHIPQGYKEVATLADQLKSAEQIYLKYRQAVSQLNESNSPTKFQDALAILESMPDYAEIGALAEKCRKAAESQALAEKNAATSKELQKEIQGIDGVQCVTGYKHVHYKMRFYENEMVLQPGGANLLNFGVKDVINAVTGGGEKHIKYASIASADMDTSFFGTENIVLTLKNGNEFKIKKVEQCYSVLSFIQSRLHRS